MKLYGLKFKHSVQKYVWEITLKNNINRSKNEAKNLQFFWYLRAAYGRFTLLELLLTRIYDQKITGVLRPINIWGVSRS